MSWNIDMVLTYMYMQHMWLYIATYITFVCDVAICILNEYITWLMLCDY